MKGIDISAWQENINWDAVKDAGIEFVIVKLGQNNTLDEMFLDHVNKAAEYGIKYGVYFYSKATNTQEAINEAVWVVDQLETNFQVEPEMGIWYDVEDSCMEGADITAICQAFIGHLVEAGYKNTGIYSSYNWLTNGNIDTEILDVPYWCAQYNSQCDFDHRNLKIWQFTDSLEIGGQNFDGNEYFD